MNSQANMVGRRIGELETPLLVVDLDKLERNIAKMRRIIIQEAGIAWRPHTKAIKVPALAHKLLKAGAHGITCVKLGEAEAMAAAGIHDILIANQSRRAASGVPGGRAGGVCPGVFRLHGVPARLPLRGSGRAPGDSLADSGAGEDAVKSAREIAGRPTPLP